jgi:hypothetical protein
MSAGINPDLLWRFLQRCPTAGTFEIVSYRWLSAIAGVISRQCFSIAIQEYL